MDPVSECRGATRTTGWLLLVACALPRLDAAGTACYLSKPLGLVVRA
jgi:hypothetical protein